MAYDPQPIDTSKVGLNANVIELTEKLAENAHNIWARQRLDDGWTLGPKRNDHKKQHPGLVPYDALPESEKQYDRLIAMQTLKAIMALGFSIAKKPRRKSRVK